MRRILHRGDLYILVLIFVLREQRLKTLVSANHKNIKLRQSTENMTIEDGTGFEPNPRRQKKHNNI
jgi:hypothetical protein